MTRALDAFDILSPEPKFNSTLSKIQLISVLNWYGQNRTSKDSERYIVNYFKKLHKIDLVLELLKDQTPTFGFVCKIIMNGGSLPPENQKWFDDNVANIKTKYDQKKNEKKEKPQSNKEIIVDRTQEKISEIIADLDGLFDDYICGDFKSLPSIKSVFHERVKNIHAKQILEWSKNKRLQYNEVLITKDKQLIEGYSCYTKAEIKKIISYFDSIVFECLAIINTAPKTRKKRKLKTKTPEQLISKLKYCKEFQSLKLKSIPPVNIIGATQLWVYNTKYKKLGLYQANGQEGFSIKGTTILNFDENRSVQKTLRKPEIILPEILKGGKVYLRNALSNINSVESKLTGRINEDVIILRVMKN